MYEFDKPPEEFKDDVAQAIWAALTPKHHEVIRRDYAQGGREAVREHVSKQIRDDVKNRDEYVEVIVDAFVEEVGES